MEIFFQLLAAHICGDVLSYSSLMAESKRRGALRGRIKALAWHSFMHGVWVLVWLWNTSLGLRLYLSLCVSLAHFAIDFIRTSSEGAVIKKEEFIIIKRREALTWFMGNGSERIKTFMKNHFKPWMLFNLIDQGLHVLVLAGLAFLVSLR